MHAGLAFGLAPLLAGLVETIRARLLGRRGPSLWQPCRELRKLLRKTPLIPETATGLYEFWPYAAFAGIAAAALLVPGFGLDLLTARHSDFVTVIGFLALSRGAFLLAGLETGFGFGGAAAARAAFSGIFPEAVLLVVLLVPASLAGDPAVDGIARFFAEGGAGFTPAIDFALAAILAVAIAENFRLPVDDPAAATEFGMLQEGLLLEYSGRFLALLRYASWLRLLVWFSLIGTLFLPFGMAEARRPASWPLGLLVFAAKLCGLAVALALLEAGLAKMPVWRVAGFLGAALGVALLAAVLLGLQGSGG